MSSYPTLPCDTQVREVDGVVGTWECGSGFNVKQKNQHFAVDGSEGTIVSLDDHSQWAAKCMTVAPIIEGP